MSNVKQLYPKQRPGINWVYIGLIFLLLIAILSSCSTTSKNKSSYKAKSETTLEEKRGIDTSSSIKADLQQQIKSNYNAGIVEESDFQKEFSIDFDFGNGSADDYTKTDTVITGTKIKTSGHGTVKLNTDGSIEVSGKIKNASYKETGKIKKQDSSSVTTITNTNLQVVEEKKGIDTTAKKATDKTETVATTKNKKTNSYWRWLLLLIIPVIWVGGWWFGLWPLLPKRKKRDPEYPVKYTNYQPPKPPIT